MHSAIRGGNLSVIKYLYSKGVSLNSYDEYGFSTLVVAILEKRIDIIQFLLKKKAYINLKDSKGRTPIDYAFKEAALSAFILDILEENNGKNTIVSFNEE